MRIPKVILGVPSILVVAFFFLPWLSVSCSGQTLSQPSGFNLAMGELPVDESVADDPEVQATAEVIETGDYELFLVPALAIFALGVVFISNELLKGLYMGAAAAALGVMGLYYFRLQQDLIEQEAREFVTYEIWWWATIAVLALMLLMGLIHRNKV